MTYLFPVEAVDITCTRKSHEYISKSPFMDAQICSTNNEPSRRYFSSSSMARKSRFSYELINTNRK